MEAILNLIILLLMLIVTYVTGSVIEKSHMKKIKQREIALIRQPVVSFGTKNYNINRPVKKIQLVHGEAVIAGDYFKNFVANIKNIFGGRLTSFESIMDRARREAILRMKEQAKGANIIINVRIESTMMNHVNMKNSVPKCAVFAYGTAITYE